MNPVEGTSASEIEALRRALDEKLSVEAADEWLSYRFHRVCDERDSLAERLRQTEETLRDLVEVGVAWVDAWKRTALCHDEFGWDHQGAEDCAEYQAAEDDAATALFNKLTALAPADPQEPA